MATAGMDVTGADVTGAGVAGAGVPVPAVKTGRAVRPAPEAGGALMGPGFRESEPRDSESGFSEGLFALGALELEPRRDLALLDMRKRRKGEGTEGSKTREREKLGD